MEDLSLSMWEEWGAIGLSGAPFAEVRGILDGLIPLKAESGLIYRTQRRFVFRRLLKLWSLMSQGGEVPWVPRLIMAPKGGVKVRTRVSIQIPQEAVEHLRGRAIRGDVQWSSWLRGLWGSCGALYLPKVGYYLLVKIPQFDNTADLLYKLLKTRGISFSRRVKDSRVEVIIRDQQKIVDFLSFLGLSESILKLENMAILRSMKNKANKLVNCDSANIAKSLEASENQLRLVRLIEEMGLEDDLPMPLWEVVRARRENPSLSLRELGQVLPHPVSKSTVEYRWRKLEKMFANLLKGDDAHVPGKGRC